MSTFHPEVAHTAIRTYRDRYGVAWIDPHGHVHRGAEFAAHRMRLPHALRLLWRATPDGGFESTYPVGSGKTDAVIRRHGLQRRSLADVTRGAYLKKYGEEAIGAVTDAASPPTPPARSQGTTKAQPLPEWMRSFVHVVGYIDSTPQDLPERMERVRAGLTAQGWIVVDRGVQTETSTVQHMLVGERRWLEMYLGRKDRVPSGAEAEAALAAELLKLNLTYVGTLAAAGEIVSQVVLPTLRQAADDVRTGFKWGLPLALGAAGLVGALYLKSFLPVRGP